MIKKFLIYCKSDGIVNALGFVGKSILSPIRKNSETVFYKWEGKHITTPSSTIQIKELSIQDMDGLDFPRLKLTTYKKWMDSGSRVFIVLTDNKQVAFTWSHYGSYSIHDLGTFVLSNKECWIGPTFVDRHYRGRGINKEQIKYQMEHSDAQVYYTSVNANNIPSRRSFEHWGFKEIGRTIESRWLNHTRFVITGEEHFKRKLIK